MNARQREFRRTVRPAPWFVLFLVFSMAALVTFFAAAPTAEALFQPASPLSPGSKGDGKAATETLRWIMPQGATLQAQNCNGIRITFPPNFYHRRVNAHCSLANVPIDPPQGWTDSGLQFFFGVWSGGGEATQFSRPLTFWIPIAEGAGDSTRPRPAASAAAELCLWNEMQADWQCVPAKIGEGEGSLSASLDRLFPTREIEGWAGNSLMAVFWAANGRATPAPAASPVPTTKPAAGNPSTLLYENDFESGAGPEWTLPRSAVTPSGHRFLGQFGAEKVRLVLDEGLPAHTHISLAFDLYIVGAWDGNRGDGLGPDRWKIAVREGPTLLSTSFGNGNPSLSPYTQSYPGWYPNDEYPKRTGAIENNTLGYPDAGDRMLSQDAVYRLAFEFDHDTPELVVEFEGIGLQPIEDESWGIDNISVIAMGE